MSNEPIQVHSVSRRFGPRLALDGVDLTVHCGEIAVIAGPNGSGKTTLLKLLAGLLRPHTGTLSILGFDPVRQRTQLMRHARFAFAPPPLYESLAAWEHMQYLTAAGLPDSERPSQGDLAAALRTVGLLDRAADKVRTFSFGMCQRLVLALALVPRPKVLVLDEPNEGLDPMAILEIRHVLCRLRDEHRMAIVLSSHLMVELDQLADRLLVLHEGKALVHGTPAELMDGSLHLVLRIDGDGERAADILREHGLHPEVADDATLSLPTGVIRLDEASRLLQSQGMKLLGFHEQRPTLAEALLGSAKATKLSGSGLVRMLNTKDFFQHSKR